MDANLTEFLKDLNEIAAKHGISIASCGCCNSPYLLDTGKEFQVVADTLTYDKELKTYHVAEPEEKAPYQYQGSMYYSDGRNFSWEGW